MRVRARTLRGSDHDLANKYRLPDARSQLAFRGIVFAGPARLVFFVVLLQRQILGHLHALDHSHPRSVVVASLRRGLSRLENHQQRLEGAEAGHVHERIGMS